MEDGELTPVTVEGLRGERFVVSGELPVLDAAEAEVALDESRAVVDGLPGGCPPGIAFLAPLDPLAWDRDLLERLFGFQYRWEVYVPAAKRRYGYYVLPLLYGDRLVGRIEPRIERSSGTLRVLGLWWEPGFDPLDRVRPEFAPAFAEALRAHAAFAGTPRIALPRSRPTPGARARRAGAAVAGPGCRPAGRHRCRPGGTSPRLAGPPIRRRRAAGARNRPGRAADAHCRPDGFRRVPIRAADARI